MNAQNKSFILKMALVVLTFGTWACIGTDVIDDEIVEEQLIIDTSLSGLTVGQSEQLSASYFNKFGIREEATITWQSSDPSIVSVDNSGKVRGEGAGQATVLASVNEVFSEPFLIGVAGNVNDVVKVEISTPKAGALSLNETITFSAQALNVNDNQLNDKDDFTWSSSNESVITIDTDGIGTAVGEGTSEITASIDGIVSSAITVTVGSSSKTASLEGRGSYTAKGTATLEKNDSGDLILTLSNDFETDFALGTFIYLANTTDGRSVRASGLDLGQVTTGGSHTFNVSDAQPGAEIADFQYVIVLCKPAGLTFGVGEFN